MLDKKVRTRSIEIRDAFLNLSTQQLARSRKPQNLTIISFSQRVNIVCKSWPKDDQVLSLSWKPRSDCFSFQYLLKQPTEASKRVVLSRVVFIISRIFDPLGLIAPVVINVKIFLRKYGSEN